MDVNEHERLSNNTLGHKIRKMAMYAVHLGRQGSIDTCLCGVFLSIPSCLYEDPRLIYVICVCLPIVASNTFRIYESHGGRLIRGRNYLLFAGNGLYVTQFRSC
jgi:hypothetical protein